MLKHRGVSIFKFLLAVAIVTTTGTTFAKNKKQADNGLSELQFKQGEERENDVKALKTEMLIANTEEKAIQQTEKLLKKYRGTPLEADLLLRLAELYMRRAKTDRFLEIQRKSDDMVKLAPHMITAAAPKKHVLKAIETYDAIEKRFPNFDRLDQAIFNNAFASQQVGLEPKAEKLFLKLIKEFPGSQLIPDAHLAAGEIDFQRRNFDSALKHFQAIKSYPDSTVYPYGLYKAAWTYYNMRDAATGLKELEAVVKYGKFVKEQGIDARLDLRKEALTDMTLFYEDVMPAKEAYSYFEKQSGEIDVAPTLLKLSDLYKRHSRHQDNKVLLSDLIKHRPLSDYIPKAYVELMDSSDKLKKRKDVVTLLGDLFDICTPDSKWSKAQDPKFASSRESALNDLVEEGDAKATPDQLCQKTFNKTALTYANRWLKIWQKTPENELADGIEKAFEIYLRRDDKSDEANRARFVYADLQFKRGKFREASANYAVAGQQSKDQSFGHDSRYYAIVSLEKATNDKWSDKDEKLYRQLADDYLKTNPKGKYALDVEFKTAFIAYEKGRYDESAPVFKKLGATHAKEERGIKSQDLYLDILNIKKDYPNLRDYAAELRKQTQNPERVAKLTKIYEEAYFFIVQEIEKKGDSEAAVKEYTAFAQNNPKSPLAQKSLWNAMQLMFKSDDLVGAAASAALYNEKFPDTKEGHDALVKAAQTYESLGLVDEAAQTLVKLAKQDKDNKAKWQLMAADFMTLSGDFKGAIELYEQLKTTPANSARALDQMEYISRAQNNAKMREQLLREISASGRQPQASIAQLYFVEKAYNAKDFNETFNLSKKLVAMDKSASKYAQGMARLYQARVLDNEFRNQSVKSKIDRLNVVLQMKTEKLSKVQVAYQSAANYGDPVVTAMAYRELANSYMHYVEALRNMPLPTGIAPEEETVFRDEIAKLATPMEEKALDTKMLALQQAKAGKLRDGTVLEVQKEVDRLNKNFRIDPIAEVDVPGALLKTVQTDKYMVAPEKTNPLACPANEKVWKKSNLEGLVEHMNDCYVLKKWDRLLAIARHTNIEFSKEAWGPYYTSLAAAKLGQLPKALWFADLALRRKDVGLIHYQKAIVQWQMEDYGSALATFDTAFKKSPELLPGLMFVGRIYYRDQDLAKASDYFKQALAIDSSNPMALAGLAEAARKKGNVTDAITYYEKAVDASPRTMDYRLHLAELYEGEKRFDQALTAYKRVKAYYAENRVPAADVNADVDDKIRVLETQLAKNDAAADKNGQSKKQGVKK
jgi:tetratricopeptide (TPR) repeat protein